MGRTIHQPSSTARLVQPSWRPRMRCKFLLPFLLASLFTLSPLAWAAHMHHTGAKSSGAEQYLETVSELTARARANVYFANPQSPFRGVPVNFVNVGRGKLTSERLIRAPSSPCPVL